MSDLFTEGDFQHDAAVEDAMIAAAERAERIAALPDNRSEWQRQADEDWDYYNDSDVGF